MIPEALDPLIVGNASALRAAYGNVLMGMPPAMAVSALIEAVRSGQVEDAQEHADAVSRWAQEASEDDIADGLAMAVAFRTMIDAAPLAAPEPRITPEQRVQELRVSVGRKIRGPKR